MVERLLWAPGGLVLTRRMALFGTALLVTLCTFSATGQAPGAAFEVASVRRNITGSQNVSVTASSGGRFGVENAPLELVLRITFGAKRYQIVGAPEWVHSEPYDIAARSEQNLSLPQMAPLIEALLADRFKLRVHRETKEMPVYELTPGKAGLKLVAKEGGCLVRDPATPVPPRRPGEPLPLYCGGFRAGRGYIDGGRITMARFAEFLSDVPGRTVVTGPVSRTRSMCTCNLFRTR